MFEIKTFFSLLCFSFC